MVYCLTEGHESVEGIECGIGRRTMKRDITKKSSATEPSVTNKDIEESTEPVRTERKRVRGKWKDSHVILLVLPVVLTILFPGGGMFYLSGRFCPGPLASGGIDWLFVIP